MPKVSNVEYETVAKICDALTARGDSVTYASIFKSLGGGSYHVVKRHLDRWRDERRAATAIALPPEIQASIGLWFAQAQEKSVALAQKILESEWAKFNAVRLESQVDMLRLLADLASANAIAAQQGHDLSLKTLQLTQNEVHLHAERLKVIELETVNETSAKKLLALEKQVSNQAAELRRERETHGRELEMADERARGTEKALLMRYHHEVEPLKTEINRLRAAFEGETAIRLALDRKLDGVAKELAFAKGELRGIGQIK